MNDMFSPFSGILQVDLQSIGGGISQEPRSVEDLFAHFEAQLASSEAAELGILLAFVGAVASIHQTHHWQSKGDTFYSDHLLFQRLYEQMTDEIDSLGERCVGLGGEDAVDVCFQAQMKQSICDWICRLYSTPSDGYNSLIELSLSAEECLSAAIEITMAHMTTRGALTRGTDNMLTTLADNHESMQYLLRRSLNSTVSY